MRKKMVQNAPSYPAAAAAPSTPQQRPTPPPPKAKLRSPLSHPEINQLYLESGSPSKRGELLASPSAQEGAGPVGSECEKTKGGISRGCRTSACGVALASPHVPLSHV